MLERLGPFLIFAGIFLFFIGIILLSIGKNKAKVEAGGAIFIGPFPVFLGGTSKNILYLVIASSFFIFLVLFLTNLIKW